MHLRIATIKKNSRVYRYGQLVESDRRPTDRMPTTRVFTSRGKLNDREEQLWQTTMRALQTGKSIVLVDEQSPVGTQPAPARPSANLAYLDVAALVQVWNQWKLGATLDELISAGRSDVRASAVILAAVIQQSINNTRIHRILDQLTKCTPQLASRLAQPYGERDGRFIRLFADVTDSWFVGHGPALAHLGQTGNN